MSCHFGIALFAVAFVNLVLGSNSAVRIYIDVGHLFIFLFLFFSGVYKSCAEIVAGYQ